MALRWMGCFAALAASAGMAAAQPPAPDDRIAPKPNVAKPLPRELPPAAADSATPVVLPPPPAALMHGLLVVRREALQEAGRCGCDDDVLPHSGERGLPAVVLQAATTCRPCWVRSRRRSPGRTHCRPAASSPFSAAITTPWTPTASPAPASASKAGSTPANTSAWTRAISSWRAGCSVPAPSSGPNGLPIVGPTFFDPMTNQKTSDPLLRAGNSDPPSWPLTSETRFWGVEANVRTRLPSIFSDRTEFLRRLPHRAVRPEPRRGRADHRLRPRRRESQLPGFVLAA